MVTPRENVVAVLNGELPEIIPCLGECPMDVTVFKDLLPASTGDAVRDAIAQAEFFGNSGVGVGLGLRQETLSRTDDHHTYRYETGAVWHETYRPTFCREARSFPINSPAEAVVFEMPDALEPSRADDERLRCTVHAFHEAGYFVQGGTIGAWQAIYYYLTRFDNILAWMVTEPEAAHALFDMTTKFSLDSARRLLACGVDCIFSPSDLGTGQGLLFSPAMFREYVFPWLTASADVCHEYGAYFHLHSHGHLQEVMDGIVEAGVDIINPLGPSDHNDLGLFKQRWGDKIVLHGGISTTIGEMSKQQIREHVHAVIETGRVGGRFFPRSESGIPPMGVDKTRFYLEVLAEERRRGYAPAEGR